MPARFLRGLEINVGSNRIGTEGAWGLAEAVGKLAETMGSPTSMPKVHEDVRAAREIAVLTHPRHELERGRPEETRLHGSLRWRELLLCCR